MKFIGIDLGTSFIKGAVLDLETLSFQAVQRVPFPERISGLPPFFHEVDPEAIISATRQIIVQLHASAPDCSGLVMCSQMGGLVLVTELGEPISNCISWQDKRAMLPHPSGGSSFDAFQQQLNADDWRRLGREVRPGLPPSLLFWLSQQGKLEKGIACTPPDFVMSRLGRCFPAVHRTNAVGALDLERFDWHHDLFRRLGFAHIRWPRLAFETQRIGKLLVGNSSLDCYPVVGDHQCALLGAFLEKDELSLNISTGSQISMLSSEWMPGDYQTRAFFDRQFLNTITNLPAGRSLNVLMKLIAELPASQSMPADDLWGFVTQEAEKIAETDLRTSLAFFPTPVGDVGAITNIREDNLTVGHLFRAAFDNMAENYFASALRLSPEQSWGRLVFSGGVAQKFALLRRIIADKLRREFRICSTSEDTFQGLLALALVAAGLAPTVGAAVALLRNRAHT